jgi:hypothetical protein
MKEQVLNGVYAETTKAFTDFGANPFEGGNWNSVQRAALLRGVLAKAHHNWAPTYVPLTPPKLRRPRLRVAAIRSTALP